MAGGKHGRRFGLAEIPVLEGMRGINNIRLQSVLQRTDFSSRYWSIQDLGLRFIFTCFEISFASKQNMCTIPRSEAILVETRQGIEWGELVRGAGEGS